MRRSPSQKRRGQAIVMTSLALFAMCGLMGLAVDVGWMYFTRRAAQRAADAAALAAVKAAYSLLVANTYACSDNMFCTDPPPTLVSCATVAPNLNLRNGCLYAQQNGFTWAGRQDVKMQSKVPVDGEYYITRTGPVQAHYWVKAVVTESVPQLFSALAGNTTALVSAAATAAIVEVEVPATLILLNHRRDPTSIGGGQPQYGLNLNISGGGSGEGGGNFSIRTKGGIRMASDCGPNQIYGQNECSQQNTRLFSGEAGSGRVEATETRIRGGGWYHIQNSYPPPPSGSDPNWQAPPTRGHVLGFDDPMSGKGQPPPLSPTNATWAEVPWYLVPGGLVTPAFCGGLSGTSGMCPPGRYFAAELRNASGGQEYYATAAPLRIAGDVTFNYNAPNGFGTTVFYGGLINSGSSVTATIRPGIYSFAGGRMQGQQPAVLFDTSTQFSVIDIEPTNNWAAPADSNPGVLFIFTDTYYYNTRNVGGTRQLPAPSGNPLNLPPGLGFSWNSIESNLVYGTVDVESGATNQNIINLHGLNEANSWIDNTTNPLYTFKNVLFWWDRGNSYVRHDINGWPMFNNSNPDDPITNTLPHEDSPELRIWTTPSVHLYGTIAQPRGTWTTMGGGGTYSGPIQLITGALNVQGSSRVDLVEPIDTAYQTIVTLIE